MFETEQKRQAKLIPRLEKIEVQYIHIYYGSLFVPMFPHFDHILILNLLALF